MTELYKKNGGVFIPFGMSLEDIEELKKELVELKRELRALLSDEVEE
jgi:hypothetical protein